jgi:hypothetical protein
VPAIEGHGVVAANTAIVLVEGDKLVIRVAASEDEAHLGMHVPAPVEDRPNHSMVVVPGTVVPGGSRNQASDIVIDHSPTSAPSFAISVLRIVSSD